MSTDAKLIGSHPAFPQADTDDYEGEPGMSLRAYFAGRALTGLLATHGINLPLREVARQAVIIADAVLAELVRSQPGDEAS
jgi:hypothetical protein